jgi:DnaJ-class molecular chaperone
MPTCPTCEGKKNVIIPKEKTNLGIAFEATCPECKGTGEVGNPNACPTCNDSKTIIIGEEIKIQVACPDCSALKVLEE